MTPEALITEQKKLEVSVWTKIITTQEHFNQMILQVRNHLLTLMTALVGAAALILQKDISITLGQLSVHVASLLFVAGLFLLLAFYLTEKGYHNLLIGAVKQAEELESQLDPMISGIKLCHRISAASSAKIFFVSWKSAWRIRIFYTVLAVLFIGAAFVTAQGVVTDADGSAVTPTKTHPAVPNDPTAGTRALKKFYSSGAYAYVVDEVINSAEAYVDARLSSVDRSKAVAVFDVDDTALSTWEILLIGEFTWDSSRFRNFVLAGKGRRIEGTLRLFQKLKAAGVPIVFITSRTEDLRDATAKNLVAEGFSGYTDLVMKAVGSAQSTKEFKSEARKRLKDEGKAIFISIGDQMDDLDSTARTGNFLLPNPFY